MIRWYLIHNKLSNQNNTLCDVNWILKDIGQKNISQYFNYMACESGLDHKELGGNLSSCGYQLLDKYLS